jgi:uncharacterized membrane protein
MPITRTDGSGSNQLARRRFYRRLLVGFLVGGTAVGLVLREGLGYPRIGEAIYWLGIIGFLAVWRGTSMTLFDERDDALERRASQITLTLFAVVLVLGASSARVLSYTTTHEVPTAIWTILWGYIAIYAVFGVVYLGLRYRS